MQSSAKSLRLNHKGTQGPQQKPLIANKQTSDCLLSPSQAALALLSLVEMLDVHSQDVKTAFNLK